MTDLEKEIEQEVKQKQNSLVSQETPKPQTVESTESSTNQTNVMEVVKQEENELLNTKELKEIGRKFGEERIKSDLAEEASKIRARNQETAQRDFETETKELRLKHLKEQLNRQHKYDMDTLEDYAKHTQMLDRRRKLVEKYGYLYNNAEGNLVECFDGKNQTYKAPKDFSYSPFVNKFRQLGRNISKLDKPMLQTIKWILILGVIGVAIFLLKKFNIL